MCINTKLLLLLHNLVLFHSKWRILNFREFVFLVHLAQVKVNITDVYVFMLSPFKICHST